ncbi:MAG: adenylyltransferase/cytidyltransferase family protein, partial [Phycisphaerae bacterium]|nr:adenylyltransferase/cytidyltransferase family protein [Phycisphaerae bacterium]
MEERCIEGLEHLSDVVRGCVLTVGNFDGVHLGHQRILAAVRSLADAEGLAAVAMTFDPPPDLVLRPRDPPQRITPALQKARLLLKAGADYAVTARAAPALLSMSPGQFVDEILVSHFAPRHMV